MIGKCLFVSELSANRPFMCGSCKREPARVRRSSSLNANPQGSSFIIQMRTGYGSSSRRGPIRVHRQNANRLRFVVQYIIKIVVRLGQIGFLGLHAALDRNAGFVHGLGASRYKPVPPVEIMALGDKPVGAGFRQPGDGAHILWRQADAVGHPRQAVGIVGAAAVLGVEQPAADACPEDLARILVLELRQAAFAAAVAKRFPFGRGHRLKRLGFPEWRGHFGGFGPPRPSGQALL